MVVIQGRKLLLESRNAIKSSLRWIGGTFVRQPMVEYLL
jgi:hypothetical protein